MEQGEQIITHYNNGNREILTTAVVIIREILDILLYCSCDCGSYKFISVSILAIVSSSSSLLFLA